MTEEQRAKQREYARQWRDQHREHLREYDRKWAEDHREHLREYRREYCREYRKRNREKCLQIERRRYQRKRQEEVERRAQFFEEYGAPDYDIMPGPFTSIEKDAYQLYLKRRTEYDDH